MMSGATGKRPDRRPGGPETRGDDMAQWTFETWVFAICMGLGVLSVAMIAFTLLWIALGKLSV